VIYVPPHEQGRLALGPGPLLNHVGDPDVCGASLDVIAQIVARTDRSCFNHPAATACSTRDGVADALAGIPGLSVPRTIRVAAASPRELRDAIRAADLAWPLLVRAAGFHGGLTLFRADRPDALDGIPWLATARTSGLYVTEFRDFAAADGRYFKYRFAVVGERWFLRHVVIGEDWLLHKHRRAANAEAEELRILASFERERAGEVEPVIREIARRVGLDFFGIDCSIDADGRLLLFEANACMKMLRQTQVRRDAKGDAVRRITAALDDLVASPQSWRTARANAAVGSEALPLRV
jgi:hypothetical protein